MDVDIYMTKDLDLFRPFAAEAHMSVDLLSPHLNRILVNNPNSNSNSNVNANTNATIANTTYTSKQQSDATGGMIDQNRKKRKDKLDAKKSPNDENKSEHSTTTRHNKLKCGVFTTFEWWMVVLLNTFGASLLVVGDILSVWFLVWVRLYGRGNDVSGDNNSNSNIFLLSAMSIVNTVIYTISATITPWMLSKLKKWNCVRSFNRFFQINDDYSIFGEHIFSFCCSTASIACFLFPVLSLHYHWLIQHYAYLWITVICQGSSFCFICFLFFFAYLTDFSFFLFFWIIAICYGIVVVVQASYLIRLQQNLEKEDSGGFFVGLKFAFQWTFGGLGPFFVSLTWTNGRFYLWYWCVFFIALGLIAMLILALSDMIDNFNLKKGKTTHRVNVGADLVF
ncbi:hypothetical protein RFI_04148 [Reticulomyxa filosa]|uniref:Uncharacterized protein n=1 Tax=Reticulomyxa filosa TaxID=46433 RepID=X6P4A7_RETFI|nr:hypothetical protein RFI_04148 [Reticulomyxa filosa]|eukprot:ETO32958.1 hypothetical protein RFI_04148 [Reticulomyxa filosa]